MLKRLPELAAFAGERAVQWVGNAVERRLWKENFIAAEQTPYQVILRRGPMSVRHYPALDADEIPVGRSLRAVEKTQHRIPVVLVPPLAATAINFDLLPNRSLVKYLLSWGYRVYLVDWGDPSRHSHLGLADYTTDLLPKALAKIRAHGKQAEVSLLGYCMGGLFCLIYAGWSHDPKIRNIVTIASPIDAHQVGIAGRLLEVMNPPLRFVSRFVPFGLHDVDPKYLRIPGWLSSLAFKLTNPLGTIQSYVDLLMNLWDREFVTRHSTTAAWFNDMYDYPGGIVQDFVVRVGLGNELAKGGVKLGRGKKAKRALLDRIECSLLAIAGENDKIVTLDAARKVLDIVGSRDKSFETAPGGHAGVFGGGKAPDTTWRIAAEWLATRSR